MTRCADSIVARAFFGGRALLSAIPKLRIGVALISALLVAACATLPDLSGYTAATVEVRQSVATAKRAVGDEIDNAAEVVLSEPAHGQIVQAASDYDAAMAKTVTAMDAMVDYAESIESIAAAGNKGKESALAVSQQVQDLAGMLGVPLAPAAAAIDAISQTGAFIYGEIAKIEAAKSLEAALAASGPSIVRLQQLVSLQIADSRRAFENSLRAQERALKRPEAYGAHITLAEQLDSQERSTVNALTGELASPAPNAATVATLRANLKTIATDRTSIAPRIAEYEAKRAEIGARRKTGNALLTASTAALEAWSTAHAKLVSAIRNRQSFTMASLNAAVSDIRELIKKWEAL